MHVRTKIRDAIVTKVTRLTTTGTRVYSHRVYPMQEEALPALVVYTSSESANRSSIGGFGSVASISRVLSVSIEVYVKATNNVINTLDNISEQVEVALGFDETLGGLSEDIQLANTAIDITADGDKPVGVLRMDYEVVYRTTAGDPTTAL